MAKVIVAPTGGFGNHLRWLMLLDNQFSFNFKINITTEETMYLAFQGEDWPEFTNWRELDTSCLTAEIFEEISSKFDINKLINSSKIAHSHTRILSTVADKIDFITQYVYNQQRTWSNWLAYELKFRGQLNDYIVLCHQYYNIDQKIPNIESDEIVIGLVAPDLAFKSYIKFNSHLNFATFDEFKDEIRHANMIAAEYAKNYPNILHLDFSVLHNKQLDKEFYKAVTLWYNLSDNYDAANEIHGIWFDLHKKAEQDIIKDFQKLYQGDE